MKIIYGISTLFRRQPKAHHLVIQTDSGQKFDIEDGQDGHLRVTTYQGRVTIRPVTANVIELTVEPD